MSRLTRAMPNTAPLSAFRSLARTTSPRARTERAKAAKRGVGDELNVASGRNVFQPGDGGGLVHASLDAVGNPRPEEVFAGAGNPAVQNDAPRLLRVGGKAQALERDGHHD